METGGPLQTPPLSYSPQIARSPKLQVPNAMAYDSNTPADHAELTGAMLRGKFNSLKDLIDALNVILAAQVDGVNTLNFNEPASATVNLVGNTLHFSFDIPRGGVGAPGQDGITGQQGPPFAQALVDAVNTLDPGQAATVSVNFDGSNVRFTFGIPRGNDGGQGGQGEQGIQGPPGTNAPNSNAVSTLDTPFADPDVEALKQRMNELILALRA